MRKVSTVLLKYRLPTVVFIVARRCMLILSICVVYFIFLIAFSFIYQHQYRISLDAAQELTKQTARQAAWKIAIGLYIQNHPFGKRSQLQSSIRYRAAGLLATQGLAFSFVHPDDFLISTEPLRGEVHITADLSYDSMSGPSKSMPSGPWYVIISWYQYFPIPSKEGSQILHFSYTDDPLAYSRFPVELAPPGIFDLYYWPSIAYSREHRFSASVPDKIFREQIATHIEDHLAVLIDNEYAKWKSIGRLSTFLYFAATFGLGEIGPGF